MCFAGTKKSSNRSLHAEKCLAMRVHCNSLSANEAEAPSMVSFKLGLSLCVNIYYLGQSCIPRVPWFRGKSNFVEL